MLPDANIPLALQTILFSALGTSGQRCTSTRRLFLHSSISTSFISSLAAAYSSTFSRIGNPLEPSTLIGPLHDAAAVQKFEQAVKEVEEQGGKILVGGKVRKMEGELKGGNWVEPTIAFFESPEKAEVMRRETFAPSEFLPFLLETRLFSADAGFFVCLRRGKFCSSRRSTRSSRQSSSTTRLNKD